MKGKGLHMITFILLIVGGLNWLLAVFSWDIGQWIPSTIMNIIYILIGLSAIFELVTHKGSCKKCGSSGSSIPTPGGSTN